MKPQPWDIDPLAKEMAWAERHGLFESPLGVSLFRAWSLGVADQGVEELILEGIRDLRAKEVFGQLEPFREPHLSEGGVLIGISSQEQEIRIPVQTLTSGTLIATKTGGGKSNLLRMIAPQVAASGAHVWIADQWKREVRHLRPAFAELGADLTVVRPDDMKYDPLHPGDCDPRRHLPNVVRVLTRRLGLGERASIILYQVCYALYEEFGIWQGSQKGYPNLFDLWEGVRSVRGANAPAREAILDRLGAVLVEIKAYRRGWNPAELAQFNLCLEMSGVSEATKHVLLEPLLYSVFEREIERGLVNAPLGLWVSVEDAQAYAQQDLSGEMTPLEVGVGLFRSTGLGVSASVQTMQGLSSKLVPNLSGLKIMGPMGTHEDYMKLGRDMGLTPEQIDWAKRETKPGVYVAKTDGWPEPFVLRVPHIPPTHMVSDEEVKRSVEPLEALQAVPATEYDDWKPNYMIHVRPRDSRSGKRSSPIISEPLLTKEQLDYLEAICEQPLMGVTERDEVLGLSAWKGNKLRTDLLRRNLVKAVAVNPGGRGRSFQLMELSTKGRELLKSLGVALPVGNGRGGVEHQWWCQAVSQWLTKAGRPNTIEDESKGARVDLATVDPDGQAIAVEVELSPGHEIDNARKDLDAGFGQVVCLVGRDRSPEGVRNLISGSRLFSQAELDSIRVGDLTAYDAVIGEAIRFGRSG